MGKWTDGEKIRAIREGVDNTGRALFPMMPYPSYRNMSDEDVQSVVAYMNSLPPIRNPLPSRSWISRSGCLSNSCRRPWPVSLRRTARTRLNTGQYLAELGGCGDCHTPIEKGQPVVAKTLAGGRVFETRYGTVVSANITPDIETGIGKWSEAYFQKKFYDYRDYAASGPPPLPGPQAFTLMPWLGLSQLPPEDLSAMYTWLRTVKPVHNYVEMHPGAPKP